MKTNYFLIIAFITAIFPLSAYSGRCICRNDIARDGSWCGERSAEARAGGYMPYCQPITINQESPIIEQGSPIIEQEPPILNQENNNNNLQIKSMQKPTIQPTSSDFDPVFYPATRREAEVFRNNFNKDTKNLSNIDKHKKLEQQKAMITEFKGDVYAERVTSLVKLPKIENEITTEKEQEIKSVAATQTNAGDTQQPTYQYTPAQKNDGVIILFLIVGMVIFLPFVCSKWLDKIENKIENKIKKLINDFFSIIPDLFNASIAVSVGVAFILGFATLVSGTGGWILILILAYIIFKIFFSD